MQFGSKTISAIKCCINDELSNVVAIDVYQSSVKIPLWRKESLKNQLYFEAQEAGSTIKLENVAGTYKTSTDGKNWDDYTLGTLCTLTNVGDKVYFSARDKNDTCYLNYDFPKFSMTGKIAAEGNIQYLLDSTGEQLSVPNYCYLNMFYNCTSMTQAPELPATTLADSCYYGIFSYCTSLTQAPELQATTLAEGCYSMLFYYCTSLTSAPALPATTLASDCYGYMFSGCTSLSSAPALQAITLAHNCCYCMFSDCSSLTSAPVLPAMTLADGCYQSMFSGCTSLSSAPELPATTIAEQCYGGMFSYCTSLTQAPVLSATTLADYCYSSMFLNCSSFMVTTDSTKQGAYQILSVDSTTVESWGTDMFEGTAGDFTGTPTTGKAYYCYQQSSKTLKMTGTNGNTSEFDEDEISDPLVYVNSSGVVQEPFASDENVGTITSLDQVNDEGLVSQIGDDAFHSCTALTLASFPTCQTIGSFAFMLCSKLISISFPACTTIYADAFYSCTALTLVSFPACQIIDTWAFCSCSALTSVSFPACQMISNGAFQSCSSLTSVSFPVCQTIGSSAFKNCSALTSVSFPACQTIGRYAFQSCYSLTSLYLMSTAVVSLASSNAFDLSPLSVGGSGIIYVPSSLVTTYKAATNWKTLAARISGI